MMFRRLMIALFAVSIVPIVWLAADAATRTCTAYRLIAGSNTCVSWRTGSEICDVAVSGLDLDANEPGNVTVTCEAAGTGPDGEMIGSLFCTPNNNEDLILSAQGINECNHVFQGVGKGHTINGPGFNARPGHEGDCQVTRNVSTGTDTFLSGQTNGLTQCNAQTGIGTCQTSIPLEIDNGAALCETAGGGDFLSFVANEFCAFVTVCGLPGTEGCQEINQLCTLSAGKYNCQPLPEGQSCANNPG